jgi:transposase-like protein
MMKSNFNTNKDLLSRFPDEQACINHLEILRWNGEAVSPFKPKSKVYICKNNKYKCKESGKYFNVKTATLFDNSKVGLQKWFLAIWIVTSGQKRISSLQLSKDIGTSQKTAWLMLQKIKRCFKIDDENDS